jgi:hypothetical protein
MWKAIIGVFTFASLSSTHALAANEKEAIKKCDIDAFREFKHLTRQQNFKLSLILESASRIRISRLWGAIFVTSKIESK